MTTDRHVWESTHETTVRARRTSQPVCGCGQDLDVCSHAHCPRCGAAVAAAA